MKTHQLLRQQTRQQALALVTIVTCGLSGAAWGDNTIGAPQTTGSSATLPLPTIMGNTNNVNDITIMQKIRQNVTADKSLSPTAQNVTVIARHGDVTLQGDVNSAPERDAVVSKAQSVAGTKNIINQITIAGKSDSDNAILPYNPPR